MKNALRLLAVWGSVCAFLGLAACEPVTVEPTSYGELVVTVLDSGSGQPLANAGVSTSPASGSFVTDAQGHATVFVAKFFGRAGLLSFISAVPDAQRPGMRPPPPSPDSASCLGPSMTCEEADHRMMYPWLL